MARPKNQLRKFRPYIQNKIIFKLIYNKPCLLIICAEATVLHGQNKKLHSVNLVVLNHTKSEQSWTKNLICYKAKISNL